MKNLFFIFAVLVLFSCNNTSSNSHNSTSAALNIDEYDFESISGADTEKAIKFNKEGVTVEEGFVKNGKKEGQWVEYNPKNGKIVSITSYINGRLTGYYFEFDDRGNLVAQAGFLNDELDGKLVKMKYGRPTEEINYKKGKLHGKKINYDRNGKVQEETDYKNGVLDGSKKFYNDRGEVTLEYIYKNGKQVGGGTVTKKLDDTPR